MKRSHFFPQLPALIALLGAFVLHAATSEPAPRGQMFKLSLGSENYLTEERIVGFEIMLKEGGFAGLPAIPIGWGIKIDNSASWQCSASGLVEVGAASMSKQELEDMFLVEAAPDTRGPPSMELVVHTTKDFTASTKRTVTTAKLVAVSKALPASKR